MSASPKRDLLGELVPPIPRFIWGLALMPLIAFTKGWLPAAAELAAALVLALLSGKRIKVLDNALIISLIIAFSLFNPHGLVLAKWGFLRVTLGALLDGIERSATIICLVFVSRASVSSSLRLPGSFGSLLAGVFSSFNRLMESKRKIERRDWVASVDKALFELFDPDKAQAEESVGPSLGSSRVSGAKYALGIVLIAVIFSGAMAVMIVSRI